MRNFTHTGMLAKVGTGMLGLVMTAVIPSVTRADDWAVAFGAGSDGFGGRVVVADGTAHLPRVGIGDRCEVVPRTVWREPVYDVRDVLVERPAKVVRERVPVYNRRGRIVGFEWVNRVVRPAYSEVRRERVLVRAGFHETVYDRVCRPVIHRPLHGPAVWPATHHVYAEPGCGTNVIREPAPWPHREGRSFGLSVAFGDRD